MIDQAETLRGLIQSRQDPAPGQTVWADGSKPQTIAITSGKGGVGKSHVALNLAIALTRRPASVCLMDAKLGLSNIDLLCGLNGYWDLSHVISGARRLREIILSGPAGVGIIPGANGLTSVADCGEEARQDLLAQLQDLTQNYQFLVLDTAAGIEGSVRDFLQEAHRVLVLTTPEPTAVADAYAMVKSLASASGVNMEILVNQAETPQQAQTVIDGLQRTAGLFLQTEIASAGYIPRDPLISRAACSGRPFLLDSPQCPAAIAIQQLARRLQNTVEKQPVRHGLFSRIRQSIRASSA